jgi:hypothetical protein
VQGAIAWHGDGGGLELQWWLWFDDNKGMGFDPGSELGINFPCFDLA